MKIEDIFFEVDVKYIEELNKLYHDLSERMKTEKIKQPLNHGLV